MDKYHLSSLSTPSPDIPVHIWDGLYDAYYLLCESMHISDPNDVGLNIQKLVSIVDSAETDLRGLQNKHSINPDCHKIGAFYTCWICKEKPIYVKHPAEFYSNHGIYASILNELFAILFSIGCINTANRKKLRSISNPTKFDQRQVEIWQLRTYLADLLYNLCHCNQSGESLAMQYFLIDVNSGNTEYLRKIMEMPVKKLMP